MVHVPSMFQLCLSFLRSLRARRKQAHPDCTQPRAAVVLVPRAGLEPAHLAVGDFESPASTYFATWAGVLFFIVWSVWSDLNRQSLASEASGLTRFSHTQMILFKPSFVSVRSDFLKMVGVKGFEPSTPCTPCKCATKLRYTPN